MILTGTGTFNVWEAEIDTRFYTETGRAILKQLNLIVPSYVRISDFLPWSRFKVPAVKINKLIIIIIIKAPATNDFQRGPKDRTQRENDLILMLFIQHSYLFAEKPLLDNGPPTELESSMLRSASSDFVAEEPSPIRRR